MVEIRAPRFMPVSLFKKHNLFIAISFLFIPLFSSVLRMPSGINSNRYLSLTFSKTFAKLISDKLGVPVCTSVGCVECPPMTLSFFIASETRTMCVDALLFLPIFIPNLIGTKFSPSIKPPIRFLYSSCHCFSAKKGIRLTKADS